MNFERLAKKGLFKEAEKLWDSKKGSLGVNTTSATPQAVPTQAPPTQAPTMQAAPTQVAPYAAAGAEMPAGYPHAQPAPPAAEHTDPAYAGAPPPQPAATAAGLAQGGKLSVAEKLQAKVLAAAHDPKLQSKAEKLVKAEAKKKFMRGGLW